MCSRPHSVEIQLKKKQLPIFPSQTFREVCKKLPKETNFNHGFAETQLGKVFGLKFN